MIVRSCLTRRATTQQCSPHLPPILYSPTTTPPQRPFHSSSSHRDNGSLPNHYETLNITPNASPSEIKKQFYTLSKSHHPDLHPTDPTAPARFVKISEAYATLGSPEKRARYDRDFLRSGHASSNAGGGRGGSFSSAQGGQGGSTPFGGRPASGLSRRRTQFRGPPPSFYSSGGWGEQKEKRSEASQQASHTHEAQGRAQSNASPNPNPSPGGTEAGMGPGGSGTGFDVPHFNHRAHAQTQSNIEQRRQRESAKRKRELRMEEADREREGVGGSVLFNFVWVSGMLLAVYWVSGQLSGAGDGGMRREKASQQEEAVA